MGGVDNSPEDALWGSLTTTSVVDAADPTWDAERRAEERPLSQPIRGAFSNVRLTKEQFLEDEEQTISKAKNETSQANVAGDLGDEKVQAAADALGLSENQTRPVMTTSAVTESIARIPVWSENQPLKAP